MNLHGSNWLDRQFVRWLPRSFCVLQETIANGKQLLGRDLDLAVHVKNRLSQQAGICVKLYKLKEKQINS
jgi:hypothetical protein